MSRLPAAPFAAPAVATYLAVFAAGLSHALSIAWPFDAVWPLGQSVWWLQLLALTVLVRFLNAATPGQAAFSGWLFATVMQCGTWWWLFISIHTYGGLAAPLAVLAVVGLAGFLALYYAAASWIYSKWRKNSANTASAAVSYAWSAIVFASFWLMAELGRVAIFTGFPWGEGGYAQLDGPFVNLAKLVGVHGLTFGAALLAAALAALASVGAKPRWLAAGLTLAGALAAAALSFALHLDRDTVSVFTAPEPRPLRLIPAPFTVALLQGNIPQDEKFQGTKGVPDALKWYGQQLMAVSATLVVTPETALPVLPEQLPDGYLDALVDRFVTPPVGQVGTAALVGIPLGNSQVGYTNSVIGLKPLAIGAADPNTVGYRYDKHHLVPFGEFVHPLFKWFLAIVNMPLSDFNRGSVNQSTFDWQGQRIAPNICYEDLFGEELAARFTDPALAPTMFVNVSNIGWFGNTIAIDQHLNISRLRAIEFERAMVRATNTGATVIIDHTGQVTHSLMRHTRGVLVGSVEGRSGITPYAWWVSRLGLWPLWLLALAMISGAFYRNFRGRRADF